MFLWHKDVDWMVVSFIVMACICVLLVVGIPMGVFVIINLACRYHWAYGFLIILEYPLVGLVIRCCRYFDKM